MALARNPHYGHCSQITQLENHWEHGGGLLVQPQASKWLGALVQVRSGARREPGKFSRPVICSVLFPHVGIVKGVPLVARQGSMRMQVRSLALLSGLRIHHCRELPCWSQMQLMSGLAVAVV